MRLMAKTVRKNSISIPLLVFALVLVASSYLYLETLKKNPREFVLRSFIKSASLVPEESTFAKSNFEWLTYIGLTNREFIKSSLISTTLTGTVVSAEATPGKLPIEAKEYFVGEKGFYQYGSTITIKTDSGLERTFYFSPQRTKAMKIMKGNVNKKFTDVVPGSKVEITETVDLAVPNPNDANLVSLTVKIL
jgi:hypothetical protein